MRVLFLIFCSFVFQFTSAATQAAERSTSIDLKKLVVEGTVPGPDLWRVTDGKNELWILGTLSPLPKKMKWNSKPIEELIKSSQALMLPPSFFFSLEGVGFFKKLSLAKSAIGIKKSPNKEKLVDVLPEEVYQRWLLLKKKYIGNSKSIEKQRPIFASRKLFDKALGKTGLTRKTGITKKLTKVAKKNDIKIMRPSIKIELDDPKASIKTFKKSTMDDIQCFSKTLERIETDLMTMSTRAKAWSYGDVKTIKALPYVENDSICNTTVLESSVGQDLGLDETRAQLKTQWLTMAQTALQENKTTFAILPISFLLKEQGVLSELAAVGYQIEEPSTLIEEPIDGIEIQP